MAIPAKPRFRGKVTYLPSPQGANLPVKGARIRVRDQDANGTDLLIDTTTDASGRFSKQATKAWQDTITITLPFGAGTRTVPDPSDLPIFLIQIDDPETGKTLNAPFGYLGDDVDVPIIVTWQAKPPPQPDPPAIGIPQVNIGIRQPALLVINGKAVMPTDPPALVWETVKDLVEANKRVTVTFGGPVGALLSMKFAANGKPDYPALRAQVCDLFGIDKNSSVLAVNPAAETLTAICVIVFILAVASPMAVGGAIFVVILAIAILLAVYLGYEVSVEREDSASDGGAIGVPLPLSKLKVVLIPPE